MTDAHGGQRLFSAAAIEGPWSDAVELPQLRGIDPDLTFTENDGCLVTYCSWQGGPSAIWQAPIDPGTGEVLEAPRPIWAGTDLGHTEGPHLYQRGDWWFLVVAEGGTERGHGVSVARSRSPRGPFESSPRNPVYTHRSTEHVVQNIGHADLVERPDRSWAAVHLGVRPRGRTPSFHVNGRETFLAEIDWIDDLPVFRPSTATPAGHGAWDVDDRFERLHPRWVSPRARFEDFTAFVNGGLQVRAAAGSGVYTRLQSLHWTATVEVDAGGTGEPGGAGDAGSDAVVHVEIRYDERHRFGVRLRGDTATAVWTVGGVAIELGDVGASGSSRRVDLASVAPTSAGPDDLTLSVDGRELARVDGRYLSTEVAAGFTGRVVGVRVERGTAVVRRIAITET